MGMSQSFIPSAVTLAIWAAAAIVGQKRIMSQSFQKLAIPNRTCLQMAWPEKISTVQAKPCGCTVDDTRSKLTGVRLRTQVKDLRLCHSTRVRTETSIKD